MARTHPAYGAICVFGRVAAACSRPPGVSRPSRRDSRLRRMRFDDSDARRAANSSLVKLASLASPMADRSATDAHATDGQVPRLLLRLDDSNTRQAANGR